MISTFKDICRGCGGHIAIGEEIHWSRESGPRCLECGPEQPDERRGSATADEDQPGYVRTLNKRIDGLEKTVSQQAGDINVLHGWSKQLAIELGVAPPKEIA